MNIPKLDCKLAVLMCSWQSPELLKQCLPAIQATAQEDTKVLVALNEGDKESVDFLEASEIHYVIVPKNYGTLSIDFLIPFVKSEIVGVWNDDMMPSLGWDRDIVELLKEHSPCAAQVRGVERGQKDGRICLGDDLPDWLDEIAFDEFQKRVGAGRYRCEKLRGLFQPIHCYTKDWRAVNYYSDGFDLNWWPGHSLCSDFPYRLSKLDPDYKFILSNHSWEYHGSQRTNVKLKAVNPAADARHNADYFERKNGLTIQEFHKLIGYGEKV